MRSDWWLVIISLCSHFTCLVICQDWLYKTDSKIKTSHFWEILKFKYFLICKRKKYWFSLNALIYCSPTLYGYVKEIASLCWCLIIIVFIECLNLIHVTFEVTCWCWWKWFDLMIECMLRLIWCIYYLLYNRWFDFK